MIYKYQPIIPYLVEELDQNNEKYNLLNMQAGIACTEFLENNFPITFGGPIDWEKLPNSFCNSWEDESELLFKFNKILIEKSIKGEVIVFWSNAIILPIEAEIPLVVKYAKSFFEEDFDTWIYNNLETWCIEIHHSGEICFGYSPERPESSPDR